MYRLARRRRIHVIGRVLGAWALVALVVSVPTPAHAAVFSNTASIREPAFPLVNGGAADPYPSTISVPASGAILDVNVTLNDLSENAPLEIQVLLVGPSGADVALMAGAGCDYPIQPTSPIDLTFDDAASDSLTSDCGGHSLPSGTYKPYGPDAFTGVPPAPAPPYGHTLGVLNGTDPSGTWKLFVFHSDTNLGGGKIAGGWSLDITTLAITSLSATTGAAGDPVTITGTGFTGATAVRFGTAPAVFTVDSDTQITASVPIAGSGPVSVTAPGGVTTTGPAFVVHHARNTSIRFDGTVAKGSVHAVDGFASCASSIPVRIQRLEGGKWHVAAAVLTKNNGSYRAAGLAEKGKYRTVAKKQTLKSGDVCLKSISPVTNR